MEISEQVKVAVLEEQMKNLTAGLEKLTSKIDTLSDKIDNNYVKKEDFTPVKNTVDSLKLWQAKMAGIALAAALVVEYLFRLFSK